MKRILVFTNYDKAVSLNKRATRKLGEYFPDKNSPITFVSESVDEIVYKHSDSFQEEGIYLIFDRINDSMFDELLLLCSGKETYALTHDLPERKEELKSLIGQERIREGHHTPGVDNYYSSVFEIITDDKGDKTKRLADLLKQSNVERIRDAIHVFYDGCWNKKVDTEEFRKACQYLLSFDDIKSGVKEYLEKKDPDIAAFISIQDLLSSFKNKMMQNAQ